jgi:hypothetical protein
MLDRILFAAVLGVPLATSACSVSSQYMTKLEVPQPIPVDPNAATVVFVRPSGYGGRIKTVILDNAGRFLGESWGKTYFATREPPGEHIFVAWSEGTPALKAMLEAGKVYYVEIGAIIGVWSLRTRLFAVGPQRQQWASLAEWLENSTMLVPDEAAGQAYAQSKADNVQEVIQKGLSNYAEYNDEDRQKRTLLPSDGVPAPVR